MADPDEVRTSEPARSRWAATAQLLAQRKLDLGVLILMSLTVGVGSAAALRAYDTYRFNQALAAAGYPGGQGEFIERTLKTFNEMTDYFRDMRKSYGEMDDDPLHQQAKMVTDIRRIEKQLQAITGIVKESPETTLAMPLLSQRLENLERAYATDVNRIYDQNKWFIGLIASMAISIIGLALSNFFRK
jgi:hypothetical protein